MQKDALASELPLTGERLGPIDYRPGQLISRDLELNNHLGCVLEFTVHSKYLSKESKAVRERKVWGNKEYTGDSDLIAILHHLGLLEEAKGYQSLCVKVAVLKGRTFYPSMVRRGYKSRKWPDHDISLRILSCYALKNDSSGALATSKKLEVPSSCSYKDYTSQEGVSRWKRALVNDESQAFWLAPPTKQAKSTSKRVHELSDLGSSASLLWPLPSHTILLYALDNQPALKYNLSQLMDRACERRFWTSSRLLCEVLYLESDTTRYELSLAGKRGSYFVYRWACVDLVKLRKDEEADRPAGALVPLQTDFLKIIHTSLDWADIIFGTSSVYIVGKEYQIRLILWKTRTKQ